MDAAAPFPVGWTGQESSPNWFDCAREYTERWHHQQQIRDAVSAEPLTDKQWLAPILQTFVHALPIAYQGIQSPPGTTICFEFTGEAGSEWTLERAPDKWILYQGRSETADSVLKTDGDTAWRIFTKGISHHEAAARTQVAGRKEFLHPFLRALAVMAVRSEDQPQTYLAVAELDLWGGLRIGSCPARCE